MPKIILMLLLTACTTSPIATKKADAREPAVQDEIACYNVITGRTFSAAECDLRACRGTDGSGRQFFGIQGHHGDGYGPCIRPPEKKAKATMSLIVNLVPASWRVEANPFKLFHHRFAPKRKWNSVNA
jgi:hypothetical protein